MLSTDPRSRLSPRERAATTTPTETIEVVSLGTMPGFRVRGVVQREGMKSRAPLREAERLERTGKARIIAGTEKVESL